MRTPRGAEPPPLLPEGPEHLRHPRLPTCFLGVGLPPSQSEMGRCPIFDI